LILSAILFSKFQGSVVQAESNGKHFVIKPPETASEEHAGQRHEAGEDHSRVQNAAAISAQGSSNCSSTN
jgi:hypothetical protein